MATKIIVKDSPQIHFTRPSAYDIVMDILSEPDPSLNEDHFKNIMELATTRYLEASGYSDND